MRPPSLLPLSDPAAGEIFDGLEVPAPDFCRAAIQARKECSDHYKKVGDMREAFSQCPFGFTTRSFSYLGKRWFVSGVVAFPRFGSAAEREMAKRYPKGRCTRQTMNVVAQFAGELERVRADAVVEGSKVLPQAFHELRKLNGAVIQHAERVLADEKDNRNLLSIKSAAELMRNNFDILEALSNIEGMKSLPLDSTVNLFDLAYKMKRVYQERAATRSISISVHGSRAIIRGSQKSFPLVPAVLIENAIKYGLPHQNILVEIQAVHDRAVFSVENRSSHSIDPVKCFDRGARFAADVEGGGFGLFLAQEVIAAHHGRIRCEVNNETVRMIAELPLSTVIQ